MQQTTDLRSDPAGKKITLEDAIKRTALFRDSYLKTIPTVAEEIKANAFSKDLLLEILNQPGCDGIRIYHALRPEPGSTTLVRELVLVGMDKQGNDLLTLSEDPGDGKNKKGCNPLGIFLALPASPPPASSAALLAGNPRPCPNMCGSKPSPLKS